MSLWIVCVATQCHLWMYNGMLFRQVLFEIMCVTSQCTICAGVVLDCVCQDTIGYCDREPALCKDTLRCTRSV